MLLKYAAFCHLILNLAVNGAESEVVPPLTHASTPSVLQSSGNAHVCGKCCIKLKGLKNCKDCQNARTVMNNKTIQQYPWYKQQNYLETEFTVNS